jgi:hypothetical protein
MGTKYLSCRNKIISCENNFFFSRMALPNQPPYTYVRGSRTLVQAFKQENIAVL